MLITVDKIPAAVGAYIDNELMPKAPSFSWQKGLLAIFGVQAVAKVDKFSKDKVFLDSLKELKVITAEGKVDTDEMAKTLKEILKGAGGTINYMGIVFNEKDADSFVRILCEI